MVSEVDTLQDAGEVRADMAGVTREARPPAVRGLPCHTSEQLNPNISTAGQGRGGKSQRTARLRVELEIQGMVTRWGSERIGFLTFTFADDVQTIAEAQRRFNSLNSNGLCGRYREWISVVQRHKDARIHFHLVVVMPEDIRTGFDFDAVKRRDYSSASRCLRDEWAFLREALPEYSFGRHELLPIKNPAGFGCYVARYVSRTGQTRLAEKGARLVRFSKGFHRVVHGPFSKLDLIERRARTRLEYVVKFCECADVSHLERKLGPAWKYHVSRLLYCRDHDFGVMAFRIPETLKLYGGLAFVIEDEWKTYDKESANEKAYVTKKVTEVIAQREADALDGRFSLGFRVPLRV